ncbi:MAG: inositol monophosphatase family protein [Nocardioidaceae bacterium]
MTGHPQTPVGAAGADPHGLLRLAVDVATSAGRLVATGSKGTVEVSDTKSSPTDVVTAVDVASEQLIRREILAARPDDAFVGEEGDDIVGTSGVTWVADPIDGTVNFLYGIAQFAVSLAASVDDEVVAGVVHNPLSGETFSAVRGAGAFLDGQPIAVSGARDLASSLVAVGYTYRADVRAHQAVETARLIGVVRDVRRFGSAALDLCFVACGRLDAYVERGLKPWDLAAGRLIAREAGGRVAGLHGAEASELIVVAAPDALFPDFEEALLQAGFGAWPMPSWPG